MTLAEQLRRQRLKENLNTELVGMARNTVDAVGIGSIFLVLGFSAMNVLRFIQAHGLLMLYKLPVYMIVETAAIFAAIGYTMFVVQRIAQHGDYSVFPYEGTEQGAWELLYDEIRKAV